MVKKSKKIKKNVEKFKPSNKMTKMEKKKSGSKTNLNKRAKINKKEIKEDLEIPNFKLSKTIISGEFDGFENNSFCAFKSIANDFFYLVYIGKGYSLIIYDLINNQKLNEIKQNYINSLKHYADSKNKRDLILSFSTIDKNLKIWNINNCSIISEIQFPKNIENQYLSTCCLLKDSKQQFSIVLSLSKEPIQIFDFNGNKTNEFQNSNSYGGISFLDVYYVNNSQKKYILMGGYSCCKSYDYDEYKEYKDYQCEDTEGNYFELIIINNGKEELIGVNDDGRIRIWDFNSGNSIKVIDINKRFCEDVNYRFGACLWNKGYLITGRTKEDDKVRYLSKKRKEDKKGYSIQIIDLINGKISSEFFEYKYMVNNIKKIEHPLYGECLLVQNYEQIDLWIKNE